MTLYWGEDSNNGHLYKCMAEDSKRIDKWFNNFPKFLLKFQSSFKKNIVNTHVSTTKFNTCYNFAIFAFSTYECLMPYACLFAKAREMLMAWIFFWSWRNTDSIKIRHRKKQKKTTNTKTNDVKTQIQMMNTNAINRSIPSLKEK